MIKSETLRAPRRGVGDTGEWRYIHTYIHACMHTYIQVSGFDVLRVSVERVGKNLTYVDDFGLVNSHGHGLRGLFLRQQASRGCPGRFNYDQGTNLTEYSVVEALESFCTTSEDAADYIFGVLAAEFFGPFPGKGSTTQVHADLLHAHQASASSARVLHMCCMCFACVLLSIAWLIPMNMPPSGRVRWP